MKFAGRRDPRSVVAAALVVGLFGCAADKAEADETDIYVSTLGNDDSGDGSRERPFRHVAKALETTTGTLENPTTMAGALPLRIARFEKTWPNTGEGVSTALVRKCGIRASLETKRQAREAGSMVTSVCSLPVLSPSTRLRPGPQVPEAASTESAAGSRTA